MSNIDIEFHKKIYFISDKLKSITSHLKLLNLQLNAQDIYIYPYHEIIKAEIEFYEEKLNQYNELYYCECSKYEQESSFDYIVMS